MADVVEDELRRAIEDLGLGGAAVMVHASLRSFGVRVRGGADGILDALLGAGCTVLVPSFVDSFFTVAPAKRLARNGLDYDQPIRPRLDGTPAGYTPDCGLVDATMGALPDRLVARPDSRRGHHPLEPFAGLGPLADELVASQSPVDVYAPIRELLARDGWILLIGVGLNRMTALHLAEQRSGRRLFVRWARTVDGRTVMAETGSCSEGFPNLAPVVDSYARQVAVRESIWCAYPAVSTVAAAAEALRANPKLSWCADAECIRCRDSTGGGPYEPVQLG